ncbi:peptidase s1 and s6 chymotrypsin/hap [Asticcacaulis sp. AC460]|uniref:S1 family peptidase n=1 Tax=Asticcacaulis sp. AC460 TaxID=1282360 RepID=UPI0003C3E7D3|nr:serine protease [Asticcacaulis sp. AC460]ESQ89294.1 peptidase s1 and s6 chymotrypsin/hap [Asticcacaulis sp. AC460]
MFVDLTVDLIEATVQLDQPINEAKRMVGTGFLVEVPQPGGAAPQVVLVTAAHVFEKMPAPDVRVGWRYLNAQGTWVYEPSTIKIRTANGPAWYQHPTQDIAVIPVQAPATFKDQAIPQAMLGDETTFVTEKVKAGEEMMTLGYPHGLSANVAGFPILRAGKVASYPLSPSTAYPTFLIDLTAVPGNSGGPVFMTTEGPKGKTFVAGVLIKQVEDDNQRLELGVVADAIFVRETIDIMQRGQATGALSQPRLTPGLPAPVQTPGGPTTDTKDMTDRKTDPAGQAAKPSGATN